jgi:NTE family protein
MEALKRAFAVVATERATSRMTVFNRGNPGLAVRASSSIPNLFWPALIEGTEYVDGALTSRVPVGVARAMGANIVIAVDVSWRGSNEAQSADVPIRPSEPQGAALDFSTKILSIKAGEAAARAAMPAIRKRIAEAALAYRKLSLNEK